MRQEGKYGSIRLLSVIPITATISNLFYLRQTDVISQQIIYYAFFLKFLPITEQLSNNTME
ncbi:hypothetical protein F4774DRAFT_365090 [Daldinia eschscholtzii]|nr:hypothetical protein F4774DRAFT_365090 [Daldinia eschscholtzii]